MKELQQMLYDKQQELSRLRRSLPRKSIRNYELTEVDGAVKLSELFGDKKDLIVIHNMGKGCLYCTLWADGFVGLHEHLCNRSAFVVISPDAPDIQQSFAKSRGWPFRMVSSTNSAFTKDLGFETEQDGQRKFMPGFSTFTLTVDKQILLVGQDVFGPGDVYNPVWHFFDLLEKGSDGWMPQYQY